MKCILNKILLPSYSKDKAIKFNKAMTKQFLFANLFSKKKIEKHIETIHCKNIQSLKLYIPGNASNTATSW